MFWKDVSISQETKCCTSVGEYLLFVNSQKNDTLILQLQPPDNFFCHGFTAEVRGQTETLLAGSLAKALCCILSMKSHQSSACSICFRNLQLLACFRMWIQFDYIWKFIMDAPLYFKQDVCWYFFYFHCSDIHRVTKELEGSFWGAFLLRLMISVKNSIQFHLRIL